MRPWMGIAAVSAAMLTAPGMALAGEHDPSLIQFKLPSATALVEFESLGANMDHAMEKNADGSVLVQAWVTDEELQAYRARGFEPVKTITDKYAIDAIREERAATVEKEQAALAALKANEAGRKGKSALPGIVRATRADYYENNVGRFISIEANAAGAHYENCRIQPTPNNPNNYVCDFVGPTIMAEWYDANGNRIGGGPLRVYTDTDVRPWYYQYHYEVFRVGDKGDGQPEPAMVKLAASNGDVDSIAAKEWIAKDPPKPAQGFKSGFVTKYNDSQEAYKKMRDLGAEFSNIAQAVKLPEQTRGYQRKAQTVLGMKTPYTNATGSIGQIPPLTPQNPNIPPNPGESTAERQAQAVVITSKAWGHQGGNDISVQLVNPGGANQTLGVSAVGNAIRVSLATDASGAITTTAAQVADAINGHTGAAALVTATPYRTSAGNGVVWPGAAPTPLSDFLQAPASFPRGPQDQYMLRIGKHRDGSKVGVFLYCQEHGNEIATSGVCLETAERLVRNYGTDEETTRLIDNLDIFIMPMINGDGGTHSLYDANRRTNLSNHCEDTTRFPSKETDPLARNNWGVDLNRNFSQGSVFDGFQGATATDCTNGNFAGLFEFSEPETRNETWVQTTHRNIKFVNNIHSSGGYFMWPPGAYTPERVPLPYPPYGTLNYFDQTAKEVLDRIKGHRNTAILPQRTGPVIDVLYSAAGNSADEAYYSNGIIGYDFEIGATHYNDTGLGTPQQQTCNPGQQPPFGTNTDNPCLLNEGFHEAMEFASGNYGLLAEALEYANDTTAPVVDAVGSRIYDGKLAVRFTSDEASSIYYTLDGSTPTSASTEYKPPRARMLPEPVEVPQGATLKWIAMDFKGNTSAVKTKAFGFTEGTVGGSVPATLSLSLSGPATFGPFVPGVERDYTATTEANVISTAGDATLAVSDPGHMTNGTFALPEPLRVTLAKTSWTAPVSNEKVAVTFKQLIKANDALRTGTYSKTLTFTLSTTNP